MQDGSVSRQTLRGLYHMWTACEPANIASIAADINRRYAGHVNPAGITLMFYNIQ